MIKNVEGYDIQIAESYNNQSKEEKAYNKEFAFKLCYPDMDPREYGYNENWEYDENIEDQYYKELKNDN